MELQPGYLADEIRESLRRISLADSTSITKPPSLTVTVAERPRTIFRPPKFLDKPAPPELSDELTRLFDELHEVHNRHVGDRRDRR